MLAYELYIPNNREAFVEKVSAIAASLGINPDWLMGVMYVESRLNPAARNPISNATGLIQFMPNTAKGLGITVDELQQMDNIRQLDYVKKYFSPYKGKMKSFIDTYMACFFPAGIGKSDDWILQSTALTASKIALQNVIYDVNRDGRITIGEVRSKLPNLEASKKKLPPKS